jgi:hypothetical protein
MEEILQLILKTYGVVGLLIAAPFIAVVFLWKENKVLRKDLESVQQKRVEDNKEVTKSVLEVAKEQSSLNKETNLLLERMSDTLDRLERS